MIGQEIKDLTEDIIDDSMTNEAFLALVNNARVKLEREGGRNWEILKVKQTLSAGTGSNTLPTGYIKTLKMYVGTQPYRKVSFEQQHLFSAMAWYLDLRNNQFTLIGSNISGTLYHFYLKASDEITLEDEVSVWPSDFHRIFAFEAAKIFPAIDQGERGMSWDDKWTIEYQLLKNAMIDWDAALQRESNENVIPDDILEGYPLSMM